MMTWLWILVAAGLGILCGAIFAGTRDRRRLTDTTRERDASRETQARSDATVEMRDRILQSMQEAVLLATPDGDIAYSNHAFELLLGVPPRAASAISPRAIREAVASAAAGGSPAPVEVEIGEPSRWLRATAAPVDPAGSVVLVVTDVTEAKRLERIRRDLVANASHELRTPAATIQAVAETARDAASSDPEALQRFLEQLEKESHRLSRIVSDMLDLSRLEAGGEGTEDVPFGALIRDELERASDQANAIGVAMESNLSPVVVRGSHRDLSLLVRNLVDNAIRYTGSGGSVRVALGREGEWAVLKVSDTGVGVPSRDLPRIFERFYRVDRARSRETGGTGLGLSIVKHVAETHGGTVSVRSELGRGSDFEIRLPAAAA